jgi:hypothetical protein
MKDNKGKHIDGDINELYFVVLFLGLVVAMLFGPVINVV